MGYEAIAIEFGEEFGTYVGTEDGTFSWMRRVRFKVGATASTTESNVEPTVEPDTEPMEVPTVEITGYKPATSVTTLVNRASRHDDEPCQDVLNFASSHGFVVHKLSILVRLLDDAGIDFIKENMLARQSNATAVYVEGMRMVLDIQVTAGREIDIAVETPEYWESMAC